MQVKNTHYILKISCIKFKSKYCNFITNKISCITNYILKQSGK